MYYICSLIYLFVSFFIYLFTHFSMLSYIAIRKFPFADEWPYHLNSMYPPAIEHGLLEHLHTTWFDYLPSDDPNHWFGDFPPSHVWWHRSCKWGQPCWPHYDDWFNQIISCPSSWSSSSAAASAPFIHIYIWHHMTSLQSLVLMIKYRTHIPWNIRLLSSFRNIFQL